MSDIPEAIRTRYPEAQFSIILAFRKAALERGYDIHNDLTGWIESLNLEPVAGLGMCDDIKFVHTRFMLLDILICWLVNLKSLSFLEITCSKLESNGADVDISVHNVVHTFSDKFVGDLLGARTLLLRSLDAQARQLCRSVSESIDAFFVTSTDPVVRSEYLSANTPELFNKFYFERIARQRARKAFHKALQDRNGKAGEAPFFDEWLNNEETLFGSAVHPTRATILTKTLVDEDFFEIGGTYPSLALSSRRTLRFISLRALKIPAVSVIAELDKVLCTKEHTHRFFEEFQIERRRQFHKYGSLILFLAWNFMARAEEEKRPF